MSSNFRSSLVSAAVCAVVLAWPIASLASSWSPGLLVNTESFQVLDEGDGTTDVTIQFGDSLAEELTFDRTNVRFDFSDDVNIQGNLRVTGAMSGTSLTVDSLGDCMRIASTDGQIGCSVAGGTGAYISVTTDESSNASIALFDIFQDANHPGGTLNYTTNAVNDIAFTPTDGRFTVNKAGAYLVTVNALVLSVGIDLTDFYVQQNGVTVYQHDFFVHSAVDPVERSFTLIRNMNAGDYLEFSIDSLTASNDNTVDGTNVVIALLNRDMESGLITQNGGDARYVNTAGDTMTGSLIIANNGALTASGNLTTNSNIALNSDNGAVDSVLTFGDSAGARTLRFNNTLNAFVFDDDVNVTGSLHASSTLSGSIIHSVTQLRSSGSLAVDGTTQLNNVAYTWPSSTATTSGAVLAVDPSNNQLSWTGPIIKRIAGNSGAAGPYITLQNLTADSANCNTTALCASVMTTTGVGAGTWKFKYTVIYQSAAVGTGIGFGINHTGTAGQFQARWDHITTGGTAATGVGDSDTTTNAGQLMEGKHDNALNAVIGSASAGVDTANADILAVIEGIIVVTASGDLELKIGSESAAVNVRLMADSVLELTKIE